jgi:prepilin-type N-terminal cleavage/methylation domain-containing protein
MDQRSRTRTAFTLIELLVVIAIIGVLIALLLPAVQKVRETGNRVVCANNLKQIGLAFQNHMSIVRYFPDGGEEWEDSRTLVNGSPTITPDQHWGWAYQILPYLEQRDVWAHPDDKVVRSTLMKVYFCPSRRAPMLVYDSRYGHSCMLDYAGNGGMETTEPHSGSPGNGLNGTVVRRPGVNAGRSVQIRISEIPDGASNTLLVAEKRMHTYLLGGSQADDDQGYVCGWDQDEIRWAFDPPAQDSRSPKWEQATAWQFGAAHFGAMNAVFADASLRTIRYNIQSNNSTANLGVWQRLCIRNDGLPVGSEDF